MIVETGLLQAFLTCLCSDSLLANSFSSLSLISWREVASLWALRYLRSTPNHHRIIRAAVLFQDNMIYVIICKGFLSTGDGGGHVPPHFSLFCLIHSLHHKTKWEKLWVYQNVRIFIWVAFNYYCVLTVFRLYNLYIASNLWMFTPDFASQAIYSRSYPLVGGCWGCIKLVRKPAHTTEAWRKSPNNWAVLYSQIILLKKTLERITNQR